MSKELPSIEELRASQKAGAEGKGLSEQTLNECLAEFNQGSGIPVADGDDKMQKGY